MLVRNKELHPCAINNHWTWYDVQISSIALFLNRTDIGKGILQTNLDKLISIQIKPDHRQPFELKRTNSWDYSLFNLQGLFKLASIGQHVGVDVWNYKNPQGAGLLTALDYLLPYLKNHTWPYPQIECSVSMSIKSCSDFIKGYNAGYSSTCRKSQMDVTISYRPYHLIPSMQVDGQTGLRQPPMTS